MLNMCNADTRKKDAFMLVCLQCVAASVATRPVSAVWTYFAATVLDVFPSLVNAMLLPSMLLLYVVFNSVSSTLSVVISSYIFKTGYSVFPSVLEPKVYRKQLLYLLKVGVMSGYILPLLDLTCEIILGLSSPRLNITVGILLLLLLL